MSIRPGDNIGDAIDLVHDELCDMYPGATFTVVIVAQVEQAGQDTIYQIGGAGDTPVEDGERIVRLAGEATRGAALLRRLRQAGEVD